MIRLLVLLAVLALAAAGFAWVADQPGNVAITWRGVTYEVSPLVGVVAMMVIALIIAFVLGFLQFLARAPRHMTMAGRARKRNKGLAAVTRGMVAAGAGDVRSAERATAEARKRLGNEPLALLLQAQTAQLTGDRAATQATFARLADHPETRVLGLRGLHAEARWRGDAEAAHDYARQAHRIAPVAWAGTAVLEHHCASRDWKQALAIVEANLAQRLIDKPTANRQRAALNTAIALELGDRNMPEALRLAREAADLAPDITPAVGLAARLLAQRGDLRKASKLIETAWKSGPHPDLAHIYVNLRPGDSAADRLVRAKALSRLAPDDPESHMCLARAAIDARDFGGARAAMAPLIEGDSRPTARMCLMMADIEDVEQGASGKAREWLGRASRAPRDKAWVADGVISDTWAPVSPVTGKLDAYRWQTPAERLTAAAWEPPPEPPAIIAPELAAPLDPSPAAVAVEIPPVESASEPDATAKLASIRAAAKQAPASRAAEILPIATAPDDPGPESVKS